MSNFARHQKLRMRKLVTLSLSSSLKQIPKSDNIWYFHPWALNIWIIKHVIARWHHFTQFLLCHLALLLLWYPGKGCLSITVQGYILSRPTSCHFYRIILIVSCFNYLGSWITSDGRCDEDIKRRLGMAKDAFMKMKNILINTKSISK